VLRYAYDARGNLASTTDPLGRVLRLEYDAADRLVRQVRPDGTVIAFAYDAAGNMLGLTPPGQPQHAFAYDANGQLVTENPPDVGAADDTTRYIYNLARQLVRETLPGGAEIDYAYCDCGRLTGVSTPWGEYAYAYSTATGQLSSLASPGGFSVSFGYDGGLVTSETVTGPVAGRIDRAYDANLRLASELVNGGNKVTFAYDADGLLTRSGTLTLTRDAANGRVTGTTLGVVTDAVVYSSYGEVSQYQALISGTVTFADQYTRDALGRITRKVESVGGVTTTTDYGYDLAGQLVTVTVDGVLSQRYAYDANGNRLSLTTPSGTVTGSYDAQDRLLTYGTKTYTYNPDGALRQVSDSATGETTAYTYDAFGNLTRVDLPDGRVIEYLIDGQNRRVGRTVDGVFDLRLVYDGQLTPVAAFDASGAVVSRFVYATGVNVPAYMVRGGVTYRLVTDHLGSVRLVVDVATGAVAQRLDYDAFGQVTLDTNPGFQPFGYAGGLYDVETALVRFGARDYDAVVGRWLAKDPSGLQGGVNLYRYANGDPITYQDVQGLQPSASAAGACVTACMVNPLDDLVLIPPIAACAKVVGATNPVAAGVGIVGALGICSVGCMGAADFVSDFVSDFQSDPAGTLPVTSSAVGASGLPILGGIFGHPIGGTPQTPLQPRLPLP
jgi:RHS repeat-associated protein